MDSSATVQSLTRFQTVTYLQVASCAVLVYDYSLTFGSEVQFVWGSKWSLGKVLFFLTRYPAFLGTFLKLYQQVAPSLTAIHCKILFQTTGWLVILGIIIAEVILAIRVWALWSRRRDIAIGLGVVSGACIIAAAIGFVKFHRSQTFIPVASISPTLRGCFPTGGTDIVFVDFAILAGFELVIFVMTMIQAFYHMTEGSTTSFVRSFYQDGITYFFFTLSISLVNMVVLLTTPSEYANLLTSLQRGLHSILSARMLLQLRLEASKTAVGGPALESMQLPPIRFAGHIDDEVDPARSWFGE